MTIKGWLTDTCIQKLVKKKIEHKSAVLPTPCTSPLDDSSALLRWAPHVPARFTPSAPPPAAPIVEHLWLSVNLHKNWPSHLGQAQCQAERASERLVLPTAELAFILN